MTIGTDTYQQGHVRTIRVDGKDRMVFTPRGTVAFLKRQETPEARRWLGLIEAKLEELARIRPGQREEELLAEAVRLATLAMA